MTVCAPGELVGRDGELSAMSDLVAALCRREGPRLVVEGEAGIGKTRLVAALSAAARDAGVAVFRGGAHPFEATRPFGPLADALDLRRRSPDPRRAAIGRLLAGQHDAHEPAPHQDVRHRVIEEIVDLIETWTDVEPAVLVLEDLHWADASTLLALRSMAHRLACAPVLLAVTLRPSPRSPELAQLVAELVAMGATAVALAPLPADQAEALVRSGVGADPGPNLRRLVGKAEGNPLWVIELLRSLSADGLIHRSGTTAEVASQELPEPLRALVLRQLAYVSPATLALLRTAAVLGDSVLVRDLAAVTGRRVVDLMGDDLAEAFRSGLLAERGAALVFRHQLVQEAVYCDIPLPVRQALHREVATILTQSGAERAKVAGHLLLGARPGDDEAVEWLRAAARESVARAPSVAVDLLRRCAELLPPDDRADAVAAELAEALLRAGDVSAAARTAEETLSRPHAGDVAVPLRLTLLSALSLQNRAAELVDWAETWLARMPGLTLADRALMLAQASYGRTFSGDVAGGEESALRALRVAEECDDTGMAAWSLTTLSVAVKTRGRYEESLACAQRAVNLAFHPPDADARLRHPHFFLGMALSDSDRPREAAAAYATALREYRELGSSWLLPDTLLMAAEQRFLAGEWDDAVAEIDQGLRIAEQHGHRVVVAVALAYRAMVATGRGDLACAANVLAGLPEGPGRYGAEVVACAASMLAEATGRDDDAFHVLLPFWKHDVDRGIGYYQRWLAPRLVRLALALSEREVARHVVAWAEDVAGLAPGVASVRSAAVRSRGLLENDVRLLLEAVDHARAGCRMPDHASACEDAAAGLVAAGRPADAVPLLVEARDRYEAAGALSWANRTAAALRGLGVRRGTRGRRRRPPHGWDSLTPSEQAVSRLVAEGLTNREVADRLFVSPHTVNTHLRHAFEKLAVPTRTSLAAKVPPQE